MLFRSGASSDAAGAGVGEGKSEGKTSGPKRGRGRRHKKSRKESERKAAAAWVDSESDQASDVDGLKAQMAAQAAVADAADAAPATAKDADGFTMTIGSRVMCDGFKYGEVKYIGPLDELPTDDVYVGVQLDEPHGSCDGSVIANGKRYFQCEPLHGIFSRPNFVTLESAVPKDNGGIASAV